MTGPGQQGAAQDDAGPAPVTVEPVAGPAGQGAEGPRARIVLVGPPGSGKSTIGRKLARELGVELYDTDAGIEADTGRGIPEIFATDGEPEFRRIEEQVVRRAVLEHEGVVSLGGGSVLSERTRAVLRGATVVYLEISIGEGLRRTGSSNARPLLNGADPAAKYRELMNIRRPLYKEVATVRVRTDGRSPGRVVRMILAKLGLESVRTDLDAERKSGNAAPPASSTSRPGIGSNRSRARRRARARAAAARRAEQPGTTERTGTADTGRNRSAAPRSEADTAAQGAGNRTGQGEQRTANTRRARGTRSRRGGARIRTAAANREAANRTAAASERGTSTEAGTRANTTESASSRAGSGQQSASPRTGTGQPAGADRTRRTPRRRGRRTTNDQRESEQRT